MINPNRKSFMPFAVFIHYSLFNQLELYSIGTYDIHYQYTYYTLHFRIDKHQYEGTRYLIQRQTSNNVFIMLKLFYYSVNYHLQIINFISIRLNTFYVTVCMCIPVCITFLYSLVTINVFSHTQILCIYSISIQYLAYILICLTVQDGIRTGEYHLYV